MATLAQIEANRRNAQRSTGPRTPEGKAAVRFNALKSGIDAASQLIPGEDPESFAAFSHDFIASWDPADIREQELVDQMIDAAWRLRRLRKAETVLWSDTLNFVNPSNNKSKTLGRSFSDNEQSFIRLQRLVAGIQRCYHQASKELERLQAGRAKSQYQTQSGSPDPARSEPPSPNPPASSSSSERSEPPFSGPGPWPPAPAFPTGEEPPIPDPHCPTS